MVRAGDAHDSCLQRCPTYLGLRVLGPCPSFPFLVLPCRAVPGICRHKVRGDRCLHASFATVSCEAKEGAAVLGPRAQRNMPGRCGVWGPGSSAHSHLSTDRNTSVLTCRCTYVRTCQQESARPCSCTHAPCAHAVLQLPGVAQRLGPEGKAHRQASPLHDGELEIGLQCRLAVTGH